MPTFAFVSTNDHAPWGGSEELWSQTAARLAQRGETVHASVRGWPRDPAGIKALEKAGVRVHRRTRAGVVQKAMKSLPAPAQRGLEAIGFRDEFSRWLVRRRPDLVVVSQGTNMQAISRIEAIARQKLRYAVLTQFAVEHDWPLDEHLDAIRTAYLNAEKAFFVSKANLALTEKQIAASLPNAAVVRNPFKLPYQERVPWPSDNGHVRLACVAALNPFHKGQDLLIEVLAREKWRERPVSLTLFGHGQQQRSLDYLIRLTGQTNVSFAGYVESVTPIWRDHHALVMGSRAEGLPLALVEAMMCGRVCVVPAVGGNAEVLEHGRTGFLARGATTELIDEVLESAWQQRDAWPEIAALAASEIRKLVPPDPVADFAREIEALLRGSVPR